LRLRKHADYQRVYRASRKQFSASMTWFASARDPASESSLHGDPLHHDSSMDKSMDKLSGPRVGLTVGKVLGKAHERNRMKRRLREAVRCHVQELPDGLDVILHPRRSVMTMDFGKLKAEVLRIFRQAAAQVREGGAAASQRAAVASREIS